MTVQKLMTRDPACCTPTDTVREAATIMRDRDCGSVPVIADTESRRLVGMITDRDIAVRGIAEGRGSDTPVRDLMSTDPSTIGEHDEVRAVEQIMAQRQVRRVPVVDEQGRCIGIVAQADLARANRTVSNREVGRIVERISEPTDEARR